MTKKPDLDAKRVLELLQDPECSTRTLAEKIGASPEAVDEARCMAEEIAEAEVDAILAMPPQLGRALLRAASQAGRHDVLVEAAAHPDKEFQREAKRLAHALKLRGVEVSLPEKRQEENRGPAEPAAASEPPVYLSSLDAFGERAAFWSRAIPGRGLELAQLVISDGRGVIDFLIAELSRKRFRELVDELPRQGDVTIREYDREEARAAIDRARVAAREGGECPTTFPAWAAQVFGPIPAEAPGPLAPQGEGTPPGDPASLAELVADSASLYAEPELSRWRPNDEAVRSFALKLEEAEASPLYLEGIDGEVQREEAVAAVVDREAARYFDPKRRGLFAGFLLDTARLFELSGRIHQARIAAATARMIAAGVPVERIPFCRQLFARLFAGRGAPPQRSPSPLLLQPEDS